MLMYQSGDLERFSSDGGYSCEAVPSYSSSAGLPFAEVGGCHSNWAQQLVICVYTL